MSLVYQILSEEQHDRYRVLLLNVGETIRDMLALLFCILQNPQRMSHRNPKVSSWSWPSSSACYGRHGRLLRRHKGTDQERQRVGAIRGTAQPLGCLLDGKILVDRDLMDDSRTAFAPGSRLQQ